MISKEEFLQRLEISSKDAARTQESIDTAERELRALCVLTNASYYPSTSNGYGNEKTVRVMHGELQIEGPLEEVLEVLGIHAE